MPALICGSIAYDTIMVFNDRFKNHILPEQVHILNVSFMVPDLRREYGGCAGNIAYNLKLLGGDGAPMGTVGKDFRPYREWMDQWGIDRSYVTELTDTYTAQAYITTDMDDNQITAFHPGAMFRSHEVQVPTSDGFNVGIIAPDGRDGMIQHAEQFVDAGIPFVFDPGQGMPLFDGDELLRFVDQAAWVALNDYESRLMQDRTGLTLEQVSERVEGLIVTRGGDGSVILSKGKQHDIPAAKPDAVEDPTGCGDAYRAGLIYGLMRGADWETTGRIASLMGAIKVAHNGTQNHHFDRDEFDHRFEAAFGHKPGI